MGYILLDSKVAVDELFTCMHISSLFHSLSVQHNSSRGPNTLLNCSVNTQPNRVTKVNFRLTSTACMHGFILLHNEVLLLLNKYLHFTH